MAVGAGKIFLPVSARANSIRNQIQARIASREDCEHNLGGGVATLLDQVT
jgi:hypothetical protein